MESENFFHYSQGHLSGRVLCLSVNIITYYYYHFYKWKTRVARKLQSKVWQFVPYRYWTLVWPVVNNKNHRAAKPN